MSGLNMDWLWHFAGLGPLLLKMGGTAVLIVVLVIFALAAPAWLLPNFSRKLALWVAAGLACSFTIYSVGVLDEAHRKDAEQSAGLKVEAKTGERFRKDAHRDVLARSASWMRHDPRNRDNAKPK